MRRMGDCLSPVLPRVDHILNPPHFRYNVTRKLFRLPALIPEQPFYRTLDHVESGEGRCLSFGI